MRNKLERPELMPKRKSQTGWRGFAHLRLAASFPKAFCAAPALLLANDARGQSLAALAQAEEAPGLIGLSLGCGLAVFAALTGVMHLIGRQRWARREAELLAETEHLRQQAERARAFLAAETQFVVVWSGARGEPEIEGDVSLVDVHAPANLSPWCWISTPGWPPIRRRRLAACRAVARARPKLSTGSRQPRRPPSGGRGPRHRRQGGFAHARRLRRPA